MLEVLFSAESPIPSHALIAFIAVLVGGIQLYMPKGTFTHQCLGYVWVSLLLYVSLSSFFISQLRTFGYFSYIHILSIATLYFLYTAVISVRRGNIKRHERGMKLLYILALLITGAFTFFPGRIMYKVIFGV